MHVQINNKKKTTATKKSTEEVYAEVLVYVTHTFLQIIWAVHNLELYT